LTKPQSQYPDPEHPAKPDSPTELDKPSWKGVLKRTFTEFMDDNCLDGAAALTYYSVLSLFPAALVLVSLLGLFGGTDTINTLLDIVRQLAGQPATEAFEGPLRDLINARAAAGTLFGVGLLGALWTASAYVAAFGRVANVIYEVEEGRPFWKLRPLQILVTIVIVLLLALVTLALVLTGPAADAVGEALGLGSLAVTLWSILKWPVLALVVSLVFAILYYATPNVKQPKFRWFTLGGLIALIVWIIASAAFGFYVANFGSYNKTYGALGAVITFLVWLWISNMAVLFGAEFDAELERGRELQAGIPAHEEIQLPPRQAPKPEKSEEGKQAKARAEDERMRREQLGNGAAVPDSRKSRGASKE